MPEKVALHTADRIKKDMNNKLKRTHITYKNSDITILSDIDAETAREELIRNYTLLEGYIQKNPFFQTTYDPLPQDDDAPKIAKNMLTAAQKTGTGPMAAVAGAFSDLLGEHLIKRGASDIIVENGGDIFLKTTQPRKIGIHAGPSNLSDKLAFRVTPEETPIGICTSSNSTGPSISLGNSDATTAVADTATLADAAASAIGNTVKKGKTINKALETAKNLTCIRGTLIIRGEQAGAWGKLPTLIKTPNTK